MIVKLFSKAGDLVHEHVMPALVDPVVPDVVVWNGRTFAVPQSDGAVARREADHYAWTYEEAVVYTCWTPEPVGWSETREKSPR